MEEEEEGEGKEELPGMPEDQDNSNPVIMPITTYPPLRHSPNRNVKQEDQDFDIQNTEQLHHIDTDFNIIALTELAGANNPDEQAHNEDQTDNVDGDW